MFYWIYKFVRFGRVFSFTLGAAFLLSSCANLTPPSDEKPEDPVSVLTGKSGGLKLSDLGKKNQAGSSMPVNATLWRASLDIASFVPLDDVDTFGGSIITEWYQPKDKSNQRLKLAIFVIGLELRSDAITVRAYVQTQKGAEWVDTGRDEELSRKLEDLILTRARELRSEAAAKTVD
ncbi:MAG: hypothetical protein CL688_06785 [Candidatus Puniceispirillum sp.]|nr:hypothetical protein [Candidatus Puniceispirillum sp.]|tara:strand:+ start:537 stop:1067 length:531 start_codon:yes stop_codon:yes gene_type:complete